MALTLIAGTQEPFQGVGALNAGTPGNLGTVTAGTFNKRAVGPRLTADTTANSLGWSADLRLVNGSVSIVRHDVTITATAAVTLGCFSCWYYFNSVQNNGANRAWVAGLAQSNGNQFLRLLISSATGTFWRNTPINFADTDTGVAYPLNQWFELRHSWRLISGTTYEMQVAYRLANSSSWVTIYSIASQAMGAALGSARAGSPDQSGSAGTFYGRYGMPSLYQMGAYSDNTLALPGVVDPLATPTTWYLDTAAGNDSNDGVTSSSAWLSLSKLQAETQYGGLFHATSYAAGDILSIKALSATPLVIGETSLTFSTRGLNVVAATGQTYWYAQLHATLAAGSWTLASGKTNVYQQTLTHTTNRQANVVAWEDDKWLNKPKLNDYANLAALLTAMDSIPGSFYVDSVANPSVLYLHPFGNTNPASDGKTYTRSINRGGLGTPPNAQNSAINLSAADMHFSGLNAGKTCVAQNTDNDSIGAYVIQSNWSSGTALIENCYLFYGSKHLLGLTDAASNSDVTISGVQVEQGSPYFSQTPFVSFNSGAGVNNTHRYVNCQNLATQGLIGSTAGSTALLDSFYSHNSSGSGQFTLVTISGCTFAGSIGGTNAITTLQVTNTTFAGSQNVGATTYTVDRCRCTSMIVTGSATTTLTVTNSTLVFTFGISVGFHAREVQGTVIYKGCTIDLRQVPSGDDTAGGIFKRIGACLLTVRDCVFLIGAAQAWTVYQNFVNTDTLSLDHNEYCLGSSSLLMRSYNDGTTTADRTLAQAQTLGLDTTSVGLTLATVPINLTTYRATGPGATSVSLGAGMDLSGTSYPDRHTPGAYEWVSPGKSGMAGGSSEMHGGLLV